MVCPPMIPIWLQPHDVVDDLVAVGRGRDLRKDGDERPGVTSTQREPVWVHDDDTTVATIGPGGLGCVRHRRAIRTDQHALVGGRPPDQRNVIKATKLRKFRDANHVVPEAPKLDRNDRREVLVEEEFQATRL